MTLHPLDLKGGAFVLKLGLVFRKEPSFVYQKFVLFLSKPQAWHIIAAQSAVHIISPFGAVSHHAPACIFPAA